MGSVDNRQVVDESLASLEAQFGKLDTQNAKYIADITEWLRELLAHDRSKMYDNIVLSGYVYHILIMNGGSFTIPGEIRANHTTAPAPYIIKHIENDDGSCTISIEYREDEEE